MRPSLLFLLLIALAPLRAAELSAAWQARIAALSAPATLTATFTESRFTPLKKRPVEVVGTVRIARGRGLSLAYDQPGSPIAILDDQGLLLRLANGAERVAPPEAETDLALLRALFAFDLATLERDFSVVATENTDGTWSLTFTRRPDSTASYRELTLVGKDARLTSIRLEKTARLSTEIALAAPVIDQDFSPAELARFFR